MVVYFGLNSRSLLSVASERGFSLLDYSLSYILHDKHDRVNLTIESSSFSVFIKHPGTATCIHDL